jgi:type IV pilus assembly protein PilX
MKRQLQRGGSLVIGNLGFKQDTTRAADRAAEAARAWLTGSGNDLTANGVSGTGYYAQVLSTLDPTGQTSTATTRTVVDWGDADSCACVSAGTCASCLTPSTEMTLNGGNVRARYVITRLCPNTGAVGSTNACAQPAVLADDTCSRKSGSSYGDTCVTTPPQQAPYYRIIVRTVGGRNTVSFTETIVH